MLITCILFAVGIILRVKGGDWFVDAAVDIARISGLPQVLIGATIVSMATTLPEVIVSVTAASHGETTMAIGNGVGSMICNIGLILAISAYFGSIVVRDRYFSKNAKFLIVYTVVLIVFSLDTVITKSEAFIQLILFVFYISSNSNSNIG